MSGELRRACLTDISGMHRVRLSVQENPLVSTVLGQKEYAMALEKGHGWVIEARQVIVAFAVANSENGSVWALFVEPGHERKGYGRQLHDVMVNWLRSQGHERLWLTTTPGTRAERFYEVAGWQRVGPAGDGETRFELEL